MKIAENPFVFFVSSLSPLAFSRKENNISNRTTRENVEKVDNPNIDQVWISIYIFFSLFLRRNYDKGGEDRIDGNIKRRGGQGFWIISIVNNDDGLPVERFTAVLFEPEHHGDGIVRLTGLYITGQSCPLSCHSLYRLHGYCNTRIRGEHWKIFFVSLSKNYDVAGGIMRFFEKEKKKENTRKRIELKKDRRGKGEKEKRRKIRKKVGGQNERPQVKFPVILSS